eukprot:6149142-Amphidinium_carterae.1
MQQPSMHPSVVRSGCVSTTYMVHLQSLPDQRSPELACWCTSRRCLLRVCSMSPGTLALQAPWPSTCPSHNNNATTLWLGQGVLVVVQHRCMPDSQVIPKAASLARQTRRLHRNTMRRSQRETDAESCQQKRYKDNAAND